MTMLDRLRKDVAFRETAQRFLSTSTLVLGVIAVALVSAILVLQKS